MQMWKLQKFAFKRTLAHVLLLFKFRGSCFLLQYRAELNPAYFAVTSTLQHTHSKAFPRSFFLTSDKKPKYSVACSRDMESCQWESAAKSHLAWVFGFLIVLCSGRESSIREAAGFIFFVFFYSATVTLQVVAVVSISEGFGVSTEVLFLADAAKHVIAIKPLYNDLLYIKKHWQDSFKLCTAN